MADIYLPYSHAAVDGDYLRIGKSAYTAYDPSGQQSVSVNTPTGADAVAMPRAVLAAAGDTGYAVVDVARTNNLMRMSKEYGARSMRERAIEEIRRTWPWMSDSRPPSEKCATVTAAVRALPLLPSDGDTVEVQDGARITLRTDPAPESDASRMLSEIRERHAADDLGDESLTQAERDRLWLLGMVDHLRAKHAEALELAMRRGERMTRAEAHLKRLTASDGRGVETLAEKDVRLRAATVHVATPEDITPCGRGHHDVPVAALIAEATCVECLRAVAVEKGEQVVELRRELHAESAHVSAARDERDQALRVARELPARTSQLELDMASAEQRLAALELAAREHTQSGGAEHAQVAGGHPEEDEN